MESIHLKTIDPLSQELIRLASRQGVELSWDRFEKLQPQDGFLRLGLSCPFGCLHGPCRIDPFGRGPEKGVCGLEKDEMAAGMLLRLCVQGALETLGASLPAGSDDKVSFSAPLGDMINEVLSNDSQAALSYADIVQATALLHRPSASCDDLLLQALRLCLLTLGFQEQGGVSGVVGPLPVSIGYGALAGQSICIGLSGQPSSVLIDKIVKAKGEDDVTPRTIVSLGDWNQLHDSFVDIVCTTGESELLVSSGAVHLLVAGPGTDPGLIQLCEKMNTPVVADTGDVEIDSLWQRARNSYQSRSQEELFAAAPIMRECPVMMSAEDVGSEVGLADNGAIALIGGLDNPQLSLGSLPTTLASELLDKQFQLAGWGDAALWVLKAGCSSQGEPMPILTLENRQGPLHVVKALKSAGQLDRLQGICFTGLNSCGELAAAIGLAYLGCRVCVATPIPVHGSPVVVEALADMITENGGQLLHLDRPAQPGELVQWFTGI